VAAEAAAIISFLRCMRNSSSSSVGKRSVRRCEQRTNVRADVGARTHDDMNAAPRRRIDRKARATPGLRPVLPRKSLIRCGCFAIRAFAQARHLSLALPGVRRAADRPAAHRRLPRVVAPRTGLRR
jgi:hypothetical protein